MDNPTTKQKILVLCTGNSARSQMAEGWLYTAAADRFEVVSAGSHPSGYVHPGAIAAMAEIGIDISQHASKSMNDFTGQSFDYVVTVCDDAAEECPFFPGKAIRLHHGFTDPAKLPAEAQPAMFRQVRDQLIAWLNEHFPPAADLITISPATHDDLGAVEALLTENHLPLDGLAQHINTAVIASQNGKLVGSAALEIYGTSALLRSVAVSPTLQRHGLGHRLTVAALALARQHGVSGVYLLTETAAEFFPRFGFTPIERDAVPDAVKQSVEFISACPDSAQAMQLLLDVPVNAAP